MAVIYAVYDSIIKSTSLSENVRAMLYAIYNKQSNNLNRTPTVIHDKTDFIILYNYSSDC